ncbi:MAG: trypsin-like peptidase domain-containing protein [bacterium]|nr:trypsin-like peptidase domain-containing protein [bacterium]
MNKKLLLLLLLIGSLLLVSGAYAQVSVGGTPVSFNKSLRSDIPSIQTGTVDVDQLLLEDAQDAIDKDIPYRFGYPFDVNYSLENSGQWETLPNGDKIWRLRVECPGAYSINLLYDSFWLPEGARLYLYSEDHSMVAGAFTSQNNKKHGEFSTQPVKGDVTVVEYYEPAGVSKPGKISISRVVHAYRDLFNWDVAKRALGFGSSGSCNNNVNCPEGADWEKEKRAAAMILTGGGSRICSGSMINNVRQDLTPYFLTANHCLGGESTWIIMFNYESPGCTNVDGPTWMTVQGTTLRASASYSDFGLLELSEQPPDSYNVHYAGWNAVDTAADSCVAIHHPSGDIKKISFNYDAVTATTYLGTSVPGDNSHWRVDNWEDGTTEPGSSGSPIYDYEHRIIGQLHGGYASCASITSDWYGKVSQSWAAGSSASSRLKDWLDPDNTGAMVLDGRDAAGISIAHTALPDTKDSLNDYEVIATITSADALVSDSLLLYYRVDAGIWYEDTLLATGNPDEFSEFIPAQSPGSVVDYYLFATDVEGNSDTTEIFSFRVIDYGMTMLPAYDEKTVAALDTAWYTLVLTNAGIYTDDYSLALSNNLWPTTLWDETETSQISSTGALLSDASLTFKARVEVPSSLYGDNDSVLVTATSTGDPSVSAVSSFKTTSAGEPFTIPFTDEFSSTTVDVGKWILNSNAESNSGGLNPPSAPYSLNLNGNPGGADTVMSQAVNLKNETNVVIGYFYEQTGSADSPESGDNLFVEYLDSLGGWQTIATYLGADPDMTDFVQVELPVPGDGYHSNFRLRIRNIGTAGLFDDWFVDDVFVGHPSDYDIQMSPSLASSNGPAGDTAAYSIYLKNVGLYDDTYDLTTITSNWSVSYWDATGTFEVSSVGPVLAGDSALMIARVFIPGSALLNEADTALIRATSQGDVGVFAEGTVVTVSAGTPVAYPWFEPFPDPTLDLSKWFYNAGANVSDSGLNPPSSPYSLSIDGGFDTVVTQLIDISAKSDVNLSYYYQRGGAGEVPDAGDDLVVQYLNSFGTWVDVAVHPGLGGAMTTFAQVTFGLPPDAYHAGFQVRMTSTGSCVDCDHWYVDDIRIDFAPSITVGPVSYDVTLQTDDSTFADLIVSNGGPGDLDYSVLVQPVLKSNSLFSALQASGDIEPPWRVYPEGFNDYEDPKGEDDPREGFPVTKNAGGPDAYGYVWIDSDEAGGPTFNWLDISGTGTDIVADLSDDNYGGPYAIGFDFEFYGNSYNSVYIGSNGIIGFGSTDMGSRFKTSIPTAGTPNDMIAWLWDDLNPTDADNLNVHVYVGMSGGAYVIQFVDYPEYGAAVGDVVNAEVILYPDGNIVMQYQSIAAGFDVLNCTIGIENGDGTDGLEVAYLTSYLHDGLAVQFFKPAQWLNLDQSSGSLLTGQADTIQCQFSSVGIVAGVYNSNIMISSNDPDPGENPWMVPAQLTVTDQPPFTCGDIDGNDAGPDVSDLTYLVDYLFGGGAAPPVPVAADVNASGDLNIEDLTYFVDFLFNGGPALTCP